MVSEAPDYSLITDLILESLGLAVPDQQDSPSSSTDQRASITVKHSYPPIYRRGVVMDHDRPYADFGHLGSFLSSSLNKKKQPCRCVCALFVDQLEIAKACRFDVAGIKAAQVRENTYNQVVVTSTRAWAISCRSRFNSE